MDQNNASMNIKERSEKLVEDIKHFGRIPTKMTGSSVAQKAQNNLYRRFCRHREKIPNELLQELQQLTGGAESADDHEGGSSEDAVRELVEDVKDFG